MSMTELKLSFPTEKLEALRFFMDKKDQTIEKELQDYLDKTYEKAVPTQVREYVESRMEQAPAQQTTGQEQAPAARERPARQTRRQREQAESAASPTTLESQTESEVQTEDESQGMTMSM